MRTQTQIQPETVYWPPKRVGRPALNLWRCWFPVFILPLYFLPLLFLQHGLFYLIACYHVLAVWLLYAPPMLMRLSYLSWQFRSVVRGRIVLHFSPKVSMKWDFRILLESIQEELDFLTKRFGFDLKRPVVIYMLEKTAEFESALGRSRVGGLALLRMNAIIVPNDASMLYSIIRHELAHLYTYRWNDCAPAILQEGIAVWWQANSDEPLAEFRHCKFFVGTKLPTLAQLLDRRHFFDQKNVFNSYNLAGHFTGFLIRRFGWEKYEQFYRSCRQDWGPMTYPVFCKRFKKCFNVDLDKVEEQWRFVNRVR